MRIVHDENSVVLRGRNHAEQFTFTKTSNYTATHGTGTVTTFNNDDSNITYTDNISIKSIFDISVGNITLPVTKSSSNTNIAVLNGNIVDFVSNGEVKVNATDNRTSKQLTGTVREYISTPSVTEFNHFVTGSLAKALDDSILALISGKTASSTTTSLTTSNNWIDTIVRNSELWCASVDITGMALAFASAGGLTAISPWHVLGAHHWFSSSALFVDSNGSIVSRTIISSQRVGSTDIRIGLLDSALPATVTPLKVLPSNWRLYLPGHIYGIGCAYLDQGNVGTSSQCGIIDTYGITTTLSQYCMLYTESSNSIAKAAYYGTNVDPPLVYNSGSPVFAILEAIPILLGTWYYAGEAPMISDYITDINSVMTSLYGSNTYQLQQINISSYPSFV